ncbi:MAG TPA: amidase family protein, partial [Gaiellaceae bacterium]|nr:amidase family protein [Gaiellaceae bacterium]
ARAAVADLADTGARLVDVRAPELDWSGVAQQLLMLPEATAAHRRRLAERLPDYGADVRARLLTGLFLPATAPVTGGRARRWLVEVAERLFGQVDLLVAPAMPVVPPPLEAQTVELDGADVPYRLALIPFNSPWSFLGLPAASVPCGFVDGLPVALSVIGPRFGESGVLQLAHAFQKVRDWHLQRPTFASDAASTGKGV